MSEQMRYPSDSLTCSAISSAYFSFTAAAAEAKDVYTFVYGSPFSITT